MKDLQSDPSWMDEKAKVSEAVHGQQDKNEGEKTSEVKGREGEGCVDEPTQLRTRPKRSAIAQSADSG